MFFFNLSLAEFLALFTAASAVVFALYLLDRSRRKVTVPTLRFWNEARRPVESTSRRRIRQWPSLLLQLASIACLLLALSQLRLGSPETGSRDHVLILDTSSWMAAREGRVTFMDQARAQALAYVRAVPATDRILLLYADALATPVTSFETDRRKLEQAIRAARPGDAALDLRQALDYAQRLQQRGGKQAGEIVFAGAARTSLSEGSVEPPPNLRLLAVKGEPENVGIRKIGLQQSPSDIGLWRVYVSLRNYGRRAQGVDLGLQFGGAPAGTRRVQIAPGSEQEAAFDLRTRAAGPLEARIRAAGDTFPGDDRAVLELPPLPEVVVTVCSNEPKLIEPLLAAHSGVRAVGVPLARCTAPVKEGILVLDRFQPAWTPLTPTIRIDPPGAGKPAAATTLQKWNAAHALGQGLRAQGLPLAAVQVLPVGAGDTVVAESSAGPLVVAREGKVREVVFGFHPMKSSSRFELSTPLIFANVLRWMSPEAFRAWELFAGSVGSVQVALDSEAEARNAAVTGPDGRALPFTVQGKSLRFFSGTPGTVRVRAGDREQVHSLTLPAVPEDVWQAPASVRRGVPRARTLPASSRDIWYWLAAAGALGLLLEWLLFSPSGKSLPGGSSTAARRSTEGADTLRRAS